MNHVYIRIRAVAQLHAFGDIPMKTVIASIVAIGVLASVAMATTLIATPADTSNLEWFRPFGF